jgi:predicted amidohydrolase
MINVAMLQSMPLATQEENLRKGLEVCKRAKAMGADIALFPEMWSTGYSIPADAEALKRLATPRDGAFVRAFADMAKELNMAIGVTYLEAFDPLPRNTLTLFDRFGREALTYAKVHICWASSR